MTMIDGVSRGAGIVARGQSETAGPTAPATEGEAHLPAPMQHLATSGDLTAQLAALVLQIGHEQRRSARVSRQAAEAAQAAAQARELRALEAEADQKLAAGLVRGASQIGAGAVQCAGTKGGDGASKIVSGMGEAQASVLERGASMAASTAKRQEQAASREGTAAEDARRVGEDATRTIDKAIDLYKEYLTARADAARAALLRA